MSCRVFKSRKWREGRGGRIEERERARAGGRRRAISFSFSFRMDDVGRRTRGPSVCERSRVDGRGARGSPADLLKEGGRMRSATYGVFTAVALP